MNALRSLLFVPGNKPSMLTKSLSSGADVLLPDMEDSVPDAEKLNARATVREFLPRLAEAGAAIVPRVNSLASGLAEADLAAVVGPHVHGVSIGKIGAADDIVAISELIADLEAGAGLEAGRIKLIPWLETTRAIVDAHAICRASERIVAVAFGAEDYTNDLGVERLDDPLQLLYARSAICTAAHAAGVLALETPYFRFRDLDGLRSDSLAAKALGFKGRFAIHPAQIPTIAECFRPSADEIEKARRIVAAFEKAEAAGRGSTSLDGMVIDVPVVKRARAVLALADEA